VSGGTDPYQSHLLRVGRESLVVDTDRCTGDRVAPAMLTLLDLVGLGVDRRRRAADHTHGRDGEQAQEAIPNAS
jgi:hypothetical protein